MTAIPVHEQKLVVIVPKGHPLAERKAVSLEETLPYPQIYFAKGSGIRNVVDRLFEDIEAKPQISCENEEDQVIAGLVAGGFGIAVVPYMDMLMKLDISILEIEYPPYRREFFMLQNNDAYLSPAAAAFRDFVADRKWLFNFFSGTDHPLTLWVFCTFYCTKHKKRNNSH